MWANMRALWVNFVRIAKHIEKICQRTFIIIKQWMLHRIIACFIIFKPFVRAIMQKYTASPEYANLRDLKIWVIGGDSKFNIEIF